MPKLIRTLVLGAVLAAMNLAGMTAVAQAQANDQPVRQPPTERQVGESWRHHQVAPESQTTTDPAAQRALARQRYWYYQSMLTSRQQTTHEQTLDAALQRLARERHSIPSATPAQVPAPVPADPSGQPGWLVASLGVLVAVLALVAAVAVMAGRRASRRVRATHTV